MCKRVLFIATCPPFSSGGGSQATRAYMDAVLDIFDRKNVDVMLFENAYIPENYQDICYIKVPSIALHKQALYYIRGYLSRFTLPLIEYMNNHKKDYNLCIINSGLVGGKAVPIIHSLGIKTVVIHHNYEVEFRRDNKSVETLNGHYLGLVKRIERMSFKNTDLNLFLTRQDVMLFQKAYGDADNCYVIGTFDYKEREKEELNKISKEFDLSISGTLANYQTTVGVLDFYKNYLAIAKQLIPNLKILLTGRAPSQQIVEIQKKENDVFSIIPNPEKILPVVRRGRVYLCPTCIGGGLKLRAMDGLKCGMPVLVHEVSSRGYDFFFEKPYFRVYNDKNSFENGLKDLLFFLTTSPNCEEQINKDYYEFFGYEKGVERMRRALQL